MQDDILKQLEAKRGEEGGKGLISVASARVGESVEIRVTDNGVGIFFIFFQKYYIFFG